MTLKTTNNNYYSKKDGHVMELKAILNLEKHGGRLELIMDGQAYLVYKDGVPDFIKQYFSLPEAYEWCKGKHGGRRIPLTVKRGKQ